MINYSRRRQKLWTELQARRLDGAVVSHPSNRHYLSGFSATDGGPNELAAVAMIGEHSTLLTGATNTAWARAEASGCEVVQWERPWTKTVAEIITSLRWERVGFEERAISVADFDAIKEKLSPAIAWVTVDDMLQSHRSIKDAAEVEALRAAIALTDQVFEALAGWMRAGQTEREIAWGIERQFRDRGGEGAAFPTIVAAGPHAARPHHNSGDRPVQEGEPIIIDMGATLAGYHGDLTRTVWFGPDTGRLREVYNVTSQANLAGLSAVGPDVPAKVIDESARSVIEKAGFGDFFVHGVGHGLGLQVHESPSVSKTSTDVLKVGQVITIEPGIYSPEWGGVRIEDVAVVTESGCSVLTTASKRERA